MIELIKISTGPQGQSVVSARDLYTFLEVKARFNDWFKRRVIKYGFLAQTDYVEVQGVLLNSEYNLTGGRPETDYALTLGMAKELAMVEGNAKGKQARQYFIECEETFQRVATQPLGPMQDIILGQSHRISQLEQRLDQVLTIQQQAAQALLALPRSLEPVPEETTRAKVQRIINAYCQAKSLSQQDVWRKVYDRLYYAYRISIRRHKKRSDRESWLDVAERCGHIDKLFAIVSQELTLS